MITTDKLNWYAAYTRVNQELVIKKKLDELGVENYLPQEERVLIYCHVFYTLYLNSNNA